MEDRLGIVPEQLASNFENGRVDFLDVKSGIENNPTIKVFGLFYISDKDCKRVMIVSKNEADEYIGYRLPEGYSDLWQMFNYRKYMCDVHNLKFLPIDMIFYIKPKSSDYKYEILKRG